MLSRLFTVGLTLGVAFLAAGAVVGNQPGAPKKAAAPRAPNPKNVKNPVVEAAKQQVKFNEADVLREAYILLATANADYAGHRAHAMGAIQAAVKALDTSVLKNGTGAQKAATIAHDNAAARAKIVNKYVKVPNGVKGPQAISDLHLRAAAQLLGQVRGALVQNKQQNILEHVDKAIKEIAVALAIR